MCAQHATRSSLRPELFTSIVLRINFALMLLCPTVQPRSYPVRTNVRVGLARNMRASTRPPSFFPFEHTFVTNGRSVVDRKRQTQNALLTTLIPTFTLPTKLIRASATANLPSPNLLAECVLVSVSTTLFLPYA